MPKVAIIIKTFLRNNSLYNLLASIEKHTQNIDYRLYIADDGPVDDFKKSIYEHLCRRGHVVELFDYDTGATKCRNEMVNKAEEKYILRLDDDYELSSNTRLDKMITVLEGNSSIGCVGDLEIQLGTGKGVFHGQTSPYQGNIRVECGKIVKEVIPLPDMKTQKTKGVCFAKCSLLRNFLLCRADIFDDVRWDPKLKFGGEHADFLLQVKRSKWDSALVLDSSHIHNEIMYNPNSKYKSVKTSNVNNSSTSDAKREILNNKWGACEVHISKPLIVKINHFMAQLYSLIITYLPKSTTN